MKLVPLNSIFNIEYGNQFDQSKMDLADKNSEGINFISRASKNFGISARVVNYKMIDPYHKGLITVTLGGSYLLASFIQPHKFYTAQNIKVLTPINEMSFNEKLFYCLCIQKNRFRYSSHGREANMSLNTLLVPNISEIPKWVKSQISLNILRKPILTNRVQLLSNNWKYYELNTLFEITASRDKLITNYTIGGKTPYITSKEFDNGMLTYVEESATNFENTITANRGGSIGFFFYQPIAYIATPVDVRILTPKFKLNKYNAFFIITILKFEKYRFNYSRKMGTARLKKLKIKLPTKANQPDWDYMENYIKGLSYSSSI